MNPKALCASLALFCLLLNVVAQAQTALPPPPPVPSQSQDKDDVVRINTNLVQVDAVVTKDGKHIKDLKADDFEIFEDGRKQTITSFTYISNVPTTPTSPKSGADAADRDKSVPVKPLTRDEARRTVALVVDDMGLSAESMSDVRRQLRKFVNEQIQPYDLVAIIRTGTDIGALQQFTNDKRVLSRTVDQLRWNAKSRPGINVLPPSYAPSSLPISEWYGESFQSSMRSLSFILDAMSQLPGRKSLVIFSDSLPVEDQNYPYFYVPPDGQFDGARRTAALRRIAEMAIRNSVVIYSIDTQGLQTTGITAADRFEGNIRMVGPQMNALMAARSHLLLDRRTGGDLIARQTGGFQVKNSNDYKLDRVLEDQSGYYLIGYKPSDETFNRRFHKITARVKRSGMSLRTRFGFFGYSEEDNVRRPQPKMRLALMSPFGSQDVELDFNSFFANDKNAGSFVRSFVYVNAKELTFETVNGKHEAKIELQGVMFGDNGAQVEQVVNHGVVSLTDEEYEHALTDGIRIRFDMPARKPGSYQVRAALRDIASSRIGAAGQFVHVPDLLKKQLAVSGVLVQSAGESRQPGALESTVGTGVRRFLPNSNLYSSCVIYNATLDEITKRPNVTIESKLFRDGKLVFSYPELQVDTANTPDLTRMLVHLQFRLGADLEPGHYYLQFAIRDNVLKKKDKQQPLIQWADFEIIK
jgi:VWFA-related protein